jgi:glycosyltransferase involved in cell wall biosynthesis
MIKILFVIENIYFGGGERAFAQIINGLNREKFDLYVACANDKEFIERIRGAAKVFTFNFRRGSIFYNVNKLAKIIREEKIQIVHSQGGRADFFARVSVKKAKVAKSVSTVATPVEGYDVGLLKKLCYIFMDRLSELFVYRFIVVSEALKTHLIKKHGIRTERIVKISNGVELSEYRENSSAREKIRLEFKLNADTLLVGFVGRLVWQKGIGYFIQAVKEIEKSNLSKDIMYFIVGEGGLRGRLENEVIELGLEDKVIFSGFRKDIKEILSAFDIFVLPSLKEGQPIVLLEAMAIGLPIVATNIDGVKEMLVDGETGMLVKPRDYVALAKAILSLAQDKEKASRLSSHAKKLCEDNFNIDSAILQHAYIYEGLIKK